MNVMDGDVSEDWLIGRRIPIFCVCCAMFSLFLCCSRCSCTQIYMRERSDGTNKEEDVMKEWGREGPSF